MAPEEDDVTESEEDDVSPCTRTDECVFSFGLIVRVDGDTFVMKEYDFATDTDVEQLFHVMANTEYGNIRCLADLRPGDSVVIDYLQQGEIRMVECLVKEVRFLDEDDNLPPDQ